jgi:hypothetical protein
MARYRWLAAVLWLVTASAVADENWVQVADPYLELHTGPGRGYPVTYVVERGKQVDILMRSTDWFKLRTDDGRTGWASRFQMESTLTEAGVPLKFRDTLLDDYRKRRFELGFAGGTLEGDALMLVRAGYRVTENLMGEITYGESSGDYSTTRGYYVAVVSQPFPEWRISPFFSLGIGKFHNIPSATLVGASETKSNMANAAIGVNMYVTQRFFVRADYRRHVAFIDENRTRAYNEISLGVGFFLF